MEFCVCTESKDAKQKSTKECLFAFYLPANKPKKFASLSKVFDINLVARTLVEDIKPSQRQDFVNSISFDAEARLLDPVIHELFRQREALISSIWRWPGGVSRLFLSSSIAIIYHNEYTIIEL